MSDPKKTANGTKADDEDIVYEYKRCLGFNGINISLTEPDALDRSIIIELDRISKENRRQESEIIAEFLKLRPKLLACIFDILAKALQIKPTIKLNDLPRMADFALWGEAISQAMSLKPFDFINAYYENIGRQNIEAIEAHPLGQAIAKFCDEEFGIDNDDEYGAKEEQVGKERNHEWESTGSELIEKLREVANKHKIDTQQRLWPKAVNSLTHRLNTIRSNLLEGLGIEVAIRKATTKEDIQKYGRNITVVKIRKTSLTSLTSLTSQNHEGKMDNFVKDPMNVNDHDP